MDPSLKIIVVGIVATAIADLWGCARRPLLGVAPPDYGLVGRWLAYMRHGQFRHAAIARSKPVAGERILGWTTHYLTGIAFAALLVCVAGPGWLQAPTLLPALAVGIATVAAPFLLMQPGMGAGLAASKTPRPHSARLQSLIFHTIFGLGLYLGGRSCELIAAAPL